MEHFSAIQVSLKTNDHIRHYATGKKSLDTRSPAVTDRDLFDIGSITKSFTAVLAVMAEREGKLKLSATLGDYLPQYPHWSRISLTALLNMSSGIPNYSDSPTLNYLMSRN